MDLILDALESWGLELFNAHRMVIVSIVPDPLLQILHKPLPAVSLFLVSVYVAWISSMTLTKHNIWSSAYCNRPSSKINSKDASRVLKKRLVKSYWRGHFRKWLFSKSDFLKTFFFSKVTFPKVTFFQKVTFVKDNFFQKSLFQKWVFFRKSLFQK